MTTPAQKIVEEAFDAYAKWEHRHSDDLEDIEMPDRPSVYWYWCQGMEIGDAIIAFKNDRQ